MDKAGPAVGILAALALFAYASTTGWFVDLFLPEPEPVDIEIVAAHVGLSHPLLYDVSITQSGPGIAAPRTYYLVGYRK